LIGFTGLFDFIGSFGFEEAQFASAIVWVLVAAQFPGEALQVFRAFDAWFHGREALEFFGEFQRELFLRDGTDASGVVFRITTVAAGWEFAQANAAFFFEAPILKSAAAPGGDIVFGDGAAGETFGEDGLDFGQGVEPQDEIFAERAIVEAMV
jgi:hypothetical protein